MDETILICHTLPNKYSGFQIGGRYKVVTLPENVYVPRYDFIYIINERDLAMKFDIMDIPEYFVSIQQWREQQLNNLLNRESYSIKCT